jgi:hypothetical protein
MQMIINSIPIEEWDRARRLYDIARVERSGLGQIRLRSDGQVRRWYATDSVRAACLDGGPDREIYDIGLPPALLRFSLGESEVSEELDLIIDSEHRSITLRGSSSSVVVEDLAYPFPASEALRSSDIEVSGRAVIAAHQLHNAIGTAWTSKMADLDDGEMSTFMLAVGNGVVELRVINRRACDAVATIICEATGDVEVEVNAQYLSSVVDLFRPDDELVLEIPRYSNNPIVLQSEGRWAILMPIMHPAAVIRQSVEATIEAELGPLAVRRDADGDYPLVRRLTPVYARLLPDEEPPILQVFAVVVNGIDGSPELMKELNELNESCTFARVFHVEDQVLAEVDLIAETLDPVELNTAVRQVWDLGQRIMPTLSAVFGGKVVPDPAAQRHALYRSSIIEAEVSPDRLAQLNGTDGVAEWPFPGVVHVLTGWNPQGVSFDPDENEHVNRQIAASIIEAGGKFVHGQGRSPSGDHTEPSLIAWGLKRDDALAIARRASQDALFEIDAHVARLVSCVGDDVEEWERLA